MFCKYNKEITVSNSDELASLKIDVKLLPNGRSDSPFFDENGKFLVPQNILF